MVDKNYFDVIVIGGGPGGYIAAIRAAQLGLKTACIDQWEDKQGGPALGGTCTNVGCIPSKALLQSSEYYEQAKHAFVEHGIEVAGLNLNLAQMLKRKDTVVTQNNVGILYLFKKNRVTFLAGSASFIKKNDKGYEIKISGKTEAIMTGQHVIIATGSKARAFPNAPFETDEERTQSDEDRILSNAGALAMETVPKKLGIIGAGVIGLEMGSVWRRLGAEVTLLEAAPSFLSALDQQIAGEAHKLLSKQGLKLHLGVNIQDQDIKTSEENVTVTYTDSQGKKQTQTFDKLIVSIGRFPYTTGLNTEAIGLELDERRYIMVDQHCKTNVDNIWAIGDVVGGPMLAHKAEEEGVAVAERIAGQNSHVNYNTIPSVIYTTPEIAWVGKTEQQLKAEGRTYRAGTFPFLANGRARAFGNTDGMVKFLADAKTDEILGVHMIGPMVSELIAEAVLAMEFQASAEDIARICHAHPSLAEATKEAALAVDKRALNF